MLDTIKKLFAILSKKQKKTTAILGVMILIGGVLETLGVSMILPLATAILDVDTLAQNKYVKMVCETFSIKDMNGFIVFLLVTVILIFVIKNAYLLVLTYFQAKFVNHNQFMTVSYLMSEYLNRPYEFYLNADLPTVFRTVDGDVPKVFTVLMEFIQLITEIVVALFLCVFLLIVDPAMTVFMGFILLIMTFIILKLLKPSLSSMGNESQELQSQMGKWRLQSIYGIKDVKVLHKEEYFVKNFSKHSARTSQIQSTYTVLNNMPRLLIETMCIGGVLGYMAIYVAMGKNLSSLVSMITAFAVAAVRLMPSVNRINGHITNIAFFKPSVDYIYETIDFEDYVREGHYVGRIETKVDDIPIENEIALKNITYVYPETDKKILDDATMIIPLGKSAGVMGPSGAGKTTAIDILLGLLQVRSGEITCGGVNIFDNYPAWLSHIGYIPQSIYLTDDSIKENIAFGVAKEDIDDERIWQVIKEAQLTDYVSELPDGINTTIGDRGIRMSGGQRQRLGIARALYHDPEILVFDEATSALDNDTESAIMEAIENFHGRKTLIIIAHRLRTIENCDLIFKVENGKIQETSLK